MSDAERIDWIARMVEHYRTDKSTFSIFRNAEGWGVHAGKWEQYPAERENVFTWKHATLRDAIDAAAVQEPMAVAHFMQRAKSPAAPSPERNEAGEETK